jgi:5-methylcytosine-specific restriction protein A
MAVRTFLDSIWQIPHVTILSSIRIKTMANPDWVRDEIILALDVYLKDKSTAGSKTHPEVIALSQLLNRLPIFTDSEKDNKFRNVNGVGMKIANFLRFEPTYAGKGLERGSKLEEDIWDEFYLNQDRLRATAQAIRQGYKLKNVAKYLNEHEDDDFTEAPEGRILTALHRRKERSQKLVNAKKRRVLKTNGRLACEACNFCFEDRYGVNGKGFIECHHNRPVSTLGTDDKTSIEDLSLLCANCHRIIHRTSPWLSVEQLKSIIKNRD